MKLTKNEDIVKIDEQMKDCDPGTLTTLATANKDALNIFGGRIGGVLDGTSDDGWHDKVRTGVTTAMEKIKGFVEEEKKSCDFISGAVGPVTNLKTMAGEYVKEFKKYEAIADNPPTRYVQEDGKDKINDNGTKTQRTEYTQWQKQVEAYEKTLPKLEAEVLRLETAVKSYFAACDFSTHTINGELYKEGDGDIKIKFDEMFRVEYDPATGTITTKDKFEIDKKFDDGSQVQATKEVERKYDDINGDGKIDEEDALIWEHVHTEGTYTDPEGNQYGFVEDTESDTIGIIKQHKEVTDRETGETVLTKDLKRNAAYKGICGETTVETTEKEDDGEWTTETRKIHSEYGEDSEYEEKVVIKSKSDDPAVGTVEYEDGRKVTTYRDADGKLHKTEQSTDKHGNPQTDYDEIVDDSQTKKVTVTYKDAEGKVVKTETMEVNFDNPLDQQRLSNKFEDARSQYYVAGSGCGPRWTDLVLEGEAGVYDCWSDSSITFTMED